jgi:hypothetical protein
MSKHRNKNKHPQGVPQPAQQPTVVQSPAKAEKEHSVKEVAKEFIATTQDRKHSPRRTTTKMLRHQDLVAFVNEFTEEFIRGELPESDIKILADAKHFLYQRPGNPYKLKDPKVDANAFVQADMKELCIHGDMIDGQKVQLQARQVSKNRVTYWNPILAQEVIKSAPNEETRKTWKARFDILNSLTPREGYGTQ